MPGKWITDKQVKIYMNSRQLGNTQALSSAKAGFSERTGRAVEHGKRQSAQKKHRHWRTRPDPLGEVWTSELEPMLAESPELQAITLLEYLQSKYSNEYGDNVLRTIQRRVKEWRIHKGPAQEVMFLQTHQPGMLGLSDFTQLKQTTITIAGVKFEHLLYHFRLQYSKWSNIKVVIGGESFTALAEGLQNALQQLGGAPTEHRTDSLSAAFKNLSADEANDVTERYNALCQHYQMKPSRNNRGKGHENGSVESAHGHIKRRIEQALLLRGNHDFTSVDEYQAFIDEVVSSHNQRNAKALSVEKPTLQPLPDVKTMDYTQVQAVVTSSSTIDVRRVTYTVPSQLHGQTLQVRLYDNRLECFCGCKPVITLERVYPNGKTLRARSVDYRHVVHSLVKKPQAFRYSQLRDDLLPSDDYRRIWQYADNTMEAKAACRFITGVLHLAATHDCEAKLAQLILMDIAKGRALSLSALQATFAENKDTRTLPIVNVVQHALHQYDELLTPMEVCHG
jgi:hypothetical protein